MSFTARSPVGSAVPYRSRDEPLPPPSEGRTYELRFDRPTSHPELTEHQLQQIWGAMQQRLLGGSASRTVVVSRFEFADEAVVALTARFPQKRQPT